MSLFQWYQPHFSPTTSRRLASNLNPQVTVPQPVVVRWQLNSLDQLGTRSSQKSLGSLCFVHVQCTWWIIINHIVQLFHCDSSRPSMNWMIVKFLPKQFDAVTQWSNSSLYTNRGQIRSRFAFQSALKMFVKQPRCNVITYYSLSDKQQSWKSKFLKKFR